MNRTRRILAIVALLALSACLSVKSLGSYESKLTLDPAVSGRWTCKNTQPTASQEENQFDVRAEQGWYVLHQLNAVADNDSMTGTKFKNLKVGPYHLMVVFDDKKWMIMRYVIEGKTAKIYSPELGFEDAETLDEATYAKIATAADTKKNWSLDMQCKR